MDPRLQFLGQVCNDLINTLPQSARNAFAAQAKQVLEELQASITKPVEQPPTAP